MNQYKNIFGKTINVHGKLIEHGQIFEANSNNEITTLLKHKYLEEITIETEKKIMGD